jgi:hypothetical protein
LGDALLLCIKEDENCISLLSEETLPKEGEIEWGRKGDLYTPTTGHGYERGVARVITV